MATHKIGIEVESKKTGDGFKQAAKQAKELSETMARLEKTLDPAALDTYESKLDQSRRTSQTWIDVLVELADEAKKAERASERLAEGTEEMAAELRQAAQAGTHYHQLTKQVKESVEEAFHAQDRFVDKTEELALATAGGAKVAYDYFQKYAKVIYTLNTGRFHTVKMAEALGLLNQETYHGGRNFHTYGEQASAANLDLSSLENSLHTLTLSVKNLTENLEKSEKRLNQGEIAVDALGTEFQDTGDRAYYLNEALFESETTLHIWQNRAEAAEAKARALAAELKETGQDAERASTDFHEAALKTDNFGEELDELRHSLDRVGSNLTQMNRGLNRVDDGLSHSKMRAEAWAEVFGNIVSNALEEAAQAAYQFAKDSVQAFYDFDRGSREVFTLIPQASGEMKAALQADMLALGTELGRLPSEMLPAVYSALSAGIPESNVLSAVKTASAAARAGVSDLATTLKLGVAILNAQVGGVANLDDIYDQLFFTVKYGVVTMPEINDVMSQITSVAGEAGVRLQDISAALIVMTRQGDSAAEAAELLSIMLTQLSTSGTTLASTFEAAAGKSFRQFIQEGGNLAGAMQLLQTHANNTGQALGDILGGGSPFFRDTQAARGALELTGKHLDELIHFANAAESATGSMATASAEMGEAAEMGALQAKAAFEEMKIAAGEAAAVKLDPLIRDATEFFKLWSGNKNYQVKSVIDELLEATQQTGNYADAVKRLTGAYTDASTGWGRFVVDQQTRNDLMQAGVEIMRQIAAESASVAEFQSQIEALDLSTWTSQTGEQLAVINDMTIYVEEFYRAVQENQMAETLARDLAQVDAKMLQMVSTSGQASDAASQYGVKLESLAQMGRAAAQAQYDAGQGALQAKEAFIASNEQIAAVAEDRAARIAAAAAAEQEAILQSRIAFNDYALRIAHGGELTTNWTNELFINAAQQGVNVEQLALLAAATGNYSEAQIQAMLTEAAMAQAVDELSAALVRGDITTQEAIQSLRDFENALANDFKANLDFGDFLQAEQQAKYTRDALLAAEGDYSATFTTTNVTINETIVKNTPYGEEIPMHDGGQFSAGELLMVGDGPGGKFVPGLTEFIVFDRPGSVIGAQDSARLFAGQKLPPDFSGLEKYATPSLINPGSEKNAGQPITINVHIYEATNRDVTDSVLLALQRGGLVN